MSKVKKYILSFLSFMVLFTSSMFYFAVPKTFAQDTNPWYFQSFPQWYTKVYDENTSPPQEIFGERYTAAQVQWVIYSLISFIVYPIHMVGSCIFKTMNLPSCLAQNPLIPLSAVTPEKDERGVLAVLFPDDRQISGVNYIRQKLISLNIIPQAEAQGFGFTALNPIQNIWKTFRDIMYGFFVIIIIVFAFMIMFRVKINPQTVVSVQSAIPKIVMTLIFVTFSFAIAGFIIDLIYVVIGLLSMILISSGLVTGSWNDVFKLLTNGPLSSGIIMWFVTFAGAFMIVLAAFITDLVFNAGTAGAVAAAILTVLSIFIFLGLLLWLLLTLARIFMLLIRTYLNIFLSVIFSPLIIGFGAVLPTGGFGRWLKELVSNLAVYPLVGTFLILASVFLGGTYESINITLSAGLAPVGIGNIFSTAQNKTFWYPPLTLGVQNGSWDPLPFLWAFASVGILAMIPNVANMIKSLMAGKGVGETGIGQAFGAIGGYTLGAARLPIERPIQIREAGREAAARTAGTGYVPELRTEFLRRIGLYRK